MYMYIRPSCPIRVQEKNVNHGGGGGGGGRDGCTSFQMGVAQLGGPPWGGGHLTCTATKSEAFNFIIQGLHERTQ